MIVPHSTHEKRPMDCPENNSLLFSVNDSFVHLDMIT